MLNIEIPEDLKTDAKNLEVSVFDPYHPYEKLRNWAKDLLKIHNMDDIDRLVNFHSSSWKADPNPSTTCPATRSPRNKRKRINRKRNKIAKLSKKKNR